MLEKGSGGEKVALIVRDARSVARQIYPQTRRTIENNINALQKFVGPEISSSKVILKSDAAQELIGAAERLSWLPEPSVANQWPHNAVLERDVRTVKGSHTFSPPSSSF